MAAISTPVHFALYSDIHADLPALDAVLASIDALGVSARYCLGDLVGYGPDPSAVIARVRATGDMVIRGNYDHGVGNRKGSCGCYYPTPEARAEGEASYARTDAALSDAEHEWLAALPEDARFEVETQAGPLRVLLTHGSPRRINEYLTPDRTDEFLAKLARGAEADVVCVGHVHIPYVRSVITPEGRPVTYVSAGSVSKPKDGDPRPCWAEVTIRPDGGVDAVFHRVDAPHRRTERTSS